MAYRFLLIIFFMVLGTCSLSSVVDGQEQQITPDSQSSVPAGPCAGDKCSYYYDEAQNVYVITKACSTRTCYCPIEVVVANSEEKGEEKGEGKADANGGDANGGDANAAFVPCAQQATPAENEIRVSLRQNEEYVNLALTFKDPAKLPDKSVRFQVKSNAVDTAFKWEIKVTYDPGTFGSHKHYPLSDTTAAKIGQSSLFYLGGSFEDFSHLDAVAAKTRVFEFNGNYKVEITRGN